MTENEAKEWIKYLGNQNLPYDRSPKSRKLACDIAIKTLEEIQQYRAIGTVEDIQMIFQLCKDLQVMCGKYHEIGTVEEFKDLKEKNNEHYSDTDELDGYGYTCTNKTCVERIRNKAIDEFAEAITAKLPKVEKDERVSKMACVADMIFLVDGVAEQMKAGADNE